MPSKVCVDASLAIKLLVQEPYSDQAAFLWQTWIEKDIERIAPAFFPFEVASTIRHKCIRKQLTEEEAEEVFNILHYAQFHCPNARGIIKGGLGHEQGARAPHSL